MLFHVGDIADRRSRLQLINQLVLSAALAIFMMIITSIRSVRANFKNEVELVKFIVVLKHGIAHAKYFGKAFIFKKIIIFSAERPL